MRIDVLGSLRGKSIPFVRILFVNDMGDRLRIHFDSHTDDGEFVKDFFAPKQDREDFLNAYANFLKPKVS